MSKTLTHLKELEAESIFILREVAAQINRDYEGKQLHLICILKGSVPFMIGDSRVNI